MHCRIWQITPTKLDEEEYIDERTFYDGDYDFFDYVSDQSDEQTNEDINEWLPNLMRGLFECNGRELTFIGSEEFLEEWCDEIKRCADEVTPSLLKDWLGIYKLKTTVRYTHKELYHRFYVGENYGAYPDDFGDFVRWLYREHKPGDKFYVGGVVDFHF